MTTQLSLNMPVWCLNQLNELCSLTRNRRVLVGLESMAVQHLGGIAHGVMYRPSTVPILMRTWDAHMSWAHRKVPLLQLSLEQTGRLPVLVEPGRATSSTVFPALHMLAPRHVDRNGRIWVPFRSEMFLLCRYCSKHGPVAEPRGQTGICLECYLQLHRVTCGCDLWSDFERQVGIEPAS